VSAADAQRKLELALIHMAKAHLGLSEEDYRYVIGHATNTRKTSAADLTGAEREKLLQHFKAKGFKVKAKQAAQRPLRDPQHRKLRAMWYALAAVGAVERPADALACDEAIETWAKRQLAGGRLGQIDALRFASGQQLNKLIEDMKAWGARVGADTAA
jgi:phage gp16-like protein